MKNSQQEMLSPKMQKPRKMLGLAKMTECKRKKKKKYLIGDKRD